MVFLPAFLSLTISSFINKSYNYVETLFGINLSLYFLFNTNPGLLNLLFDIGDSKLKLEFIFGIKGEPTFKLLFYM